LGRRTPRASPIDYAAVPADREGHEALPIERLGEEGSVIPSSERSRIVGTGDCSPRGFTRRSDARWWVPERGWNGHRTGDPSRRTTSIPRTATQLVGLNPPGPRVIGARLA